MKRVVWVACLFLLSACASAPERKEPPPEFTKDAVMFQLSYEAAFDKTVRALESEGYDVAIADKRAGVIQTHPKNLPIAPEEAPIRYRGLYMIQIDGDSDRSWAVIRFAVLPELPGEREKLIQKIQGESPAP
jgi:hypothetical protein